VTLSRVRRERMGHISLAAPVAISGSEILAFAHRASLDMTLRTSSASFISNPISSSIRA
jgi:hypothetical protein